MTATGIVALFSGLSAASAGANGSVDGLLSMLSAMRWVLQSSRPLTDSSKKLYTQFPPWYWRWRRIPLWICLGIWTVRGTWYQQECTTSLVRSSHELVIPFHFSHASHDNLRRLYDWFWFRHFCLCSAGAFLDVSLKWTFFQIIH